MGEVVELPKLHRTRAGKSDARKASSAKVRRLKQRAKQGAFTTGTLSLPILGELMRTLPSAPPLPPGEALLEAGVLAFRRETSGETLILLISKKRSKNWGIPKGKCVPHLSFPENAAKEAYEEAGVLGAISPSAVGMFRARKRGSPARAERTMEIWVYLLEVAEMLADWPEKRKRKTRWVSCEAAARQLREPVLAHLCHRLAQS
ncbi:MAG TPA: NUDIX hydrolase [Stellaceae bacterium]|jgi:8-oxo-dGTP pyrophosphatase MutT (NUDIX family)|nr:NUDIX hydrolase [Stellaceae bacterium]